MRTVTRTAQTDQVRHLSENLVSQLTHGREWATPGVEAALKRVVAGLDAGIESASPRIQTRLRRLAEELAGGVALDHRGLFLAGMRGAFSRHRLPGSGHSRVSGSGPSRGGCPAFSDGAVVAGRIVWRAGSAEAISCGSVVSVDDRWAALNTKSKNIVGEATRSLS